MSVQQRMQELLGKAGIPAKEIKVYGSQVMITCWGRDSAVRFGDLLKTFCSKVRGPIQTADYDKVNQNTVLKPSRHEVWRVWGTI